MSTVAIILGGIAFLIVPIIFGPIAIILASIAKSKGERLAPVALTVAIVGTLVGMFIGAVIGALTF